MTCTCSSCKNAFERHQQATAHALELWTSLHIRGCVGELPHLDASSYIVFQVQALLYPDREGEHRWASCYAHSYRDVAGEVRMMSSPTYKPLLERPERVTWGNGMGPARSFGESLAFTTAEAAVELHERMNGIVAWNSDWESSQPWHIEGRKRRVQTRVVELLMASSTRLVTKEEG